MEFSESKGHIKLKKRMYFVLAKGVGSEAQVPSYSAGGCREIFNLGIEEARNRFVFIPLPWFVLATAGFAPNFSRIMTITVAIGPFILLLGLLIND